ncbi:MAG: alanine racemase [Clostridia bacterium]|nr:alanine racemase [Clostridia bacterium]
MIRPTNAEVRLDLIRHNINIIRSRLKPETKFLAVVKANAYGHGLKTVANYLQQNGVDFFAVAIVEEGIRLRNAGITLPVLILGVTPEANWIDVVRYDLTPAVFTPGQLRALEAAAEEQNKTCSVHLKIDTGMNRIGIKTEEDFLTLLDVLKECPHLSFSGMFTHFAISECPDKAFTRYQAKVFERFIALAHAAGHRPLIHAANSGAALMMPEVQYDMVRGGLAMYGYHPIGHPVEGTDLRPALSWKTSIVHIKHIEIGESVSYGRRFIAERPTTVATLPVGYGDGYKRALSGKAHVIIRGKKAPVLGAVCMDQCMCDITDIPEAEIGDEVILLGSQGNEAVTADDMAELCDTISYEILLSISDRVPRIYPEA